MNDNDKKLEDAALAYIKENKKSLTAKFVDGCFNSDMPVSVFMAGSPGAGKTEVSKRMALRFEVANKMKMLRIDPDEIRNEIPGYTGGNSYIYQRAATKMAHHLHDFALNKGFHFLFDATFAIHEDGAMENIARSLKRKRPVYIEYIFQDPLVA